MPKKKVERKEKEDGSLSNVRAQFILLKETHPNIADLWLAEGALGHHTLKQAQQVLQTCATTADYDRDTLNLIKLYALSQKTTAKEKED